MVVERTPTVFVSSTCYDLKQTREDIKDFFQSNYNFNVMLSEFNSFPVDPCIGTFENCLKNVDNYADVFVLIIGNRYGYVTDQGKSITNLEYLHARAKGIPVFVFVNKQLYNNLPLWRMNKNGDFSAVVDNPAIFEFVSGIFDELKQWIYTYDSVHDITVTLKNQLLGIFADGLKYKRLISKQPNSIFEYGVSPDALRVIIEQPYAWEYKFLAYVLKEDFNNLKNQRWNYKYGLSTFHSLTVESTAFIDEIMEKLNEISSLVEYMNTLINSVIPDAIGESGKPSDLEMILYASSKLASVYERLIDWALFYKTLHVDEKYTRLLELLYELPKSVLNSIDDFVDRMYNEITRLPAVDDGVKRRINITCILDEANANAITDEINHLCKSLHE